MDKFDLFWAKYLKDESRTKDKKDLTDSDFTIRPVLILDNDIIVKVAKVTTHKERKNFPNEYTIKNWKESGLTSQSTIRFSKKDLITKEYLLDKLGHLSEEDINAIKELKLVESLKEDLKKNNAKKLFGLISADVNVDYVILASDTDNRPIMNSNLYDTAKKEIESGIKVEGSWKDPKTNIVVPQSNSYILKKSLADAKKLAKDLCQQDFIMFKFTDDSHVVSQVYRTVDDVYSDYNKYKSSSDEVVFDSDASRLNYYSKIGNTPFSFGLYGNKFGLNESIEENIEKHETLNDKIFDIETQEMLPEVREKLLEIANTFIEKVHEDELDLEVKDVVLIGSNANYNYTKDSDLDVHIIASSKPDCNKKHLDKIYQAYKSMFNKNYDIYIHDIPTEIYVEMDKVNARSGGIYSIQENKWLKQPQQFEIPDIDYDAFYKEFEKWEERYFELVDYLNEYENASEEVDKYIDDIYEVRKEGIAKSGEFDIANLVFKEVRNRGYLDNLKELKTELESKELSLESIDK